MKLRYMAIGAGAALATAVVAGTVIALRRTDSPASPKPPTPDSKDPQEPGFVTVQGAQLVRDGKPFRPFGFNHTTHGSLGTGNYFQNPTPANLAAVRTEFAEAKRLGANTLRIFLELHDFVERDASGAVFTRLERLKAYADVVAEAERQGLVLDVTGNLVWKPDSAPAWYDEMSNEQRWQVQATFWRDVAKVGADSPAVMSYELTSEPVAKADANAPWYGGRFGNLNFVQTMARGVPGEAANQAIRSWVTTLSSAIRQSDKNHPISVGMLPFAQGPASPANLADLLDFLILHDYPKGVASDPHAIDPHVETARKFASHGKPVLLGETAALNSDNITEERYLRATRQYLVGALSFYDGRDPENMQVNTIADAMYQANLRSFIGMRGEL